MDSTVLPVSELSHNWITVVLASYLYETLAAVKLIIKLTAYVLLSEHI